MPAYLLHGFRWHRTNIRVHVILNNLDDATPEWLLAPATSVSILNSLYKHYDFLPPCHPPPIGYAHIPIPPIPPEEIDPPDERSMTPRVKKSKSLLSLRSLSRGGKKNNRPAEPAPPENGHNNLGERKISLSGSDHRPSTTSRSTLTKSLKSEKKSNFNDWSVVKLMEQYDPADLHTVSQPYAYVADYMVEILLGIAITEEMARYEMEMKSDDGSSPVTPVTAGLPEHEDPGSPNGSLNMSMRDKKSKTRGPGWLEKLRDGLQNGEDIGWYVVVCGDEERAPPSMESTRRSVGVNDYQQLRPPKSAGFTRLFRKSSPWEND